MYDVITMDPEEIVTNSTMNGGNVPYKLGI